MDNPRFPLKYKFIFFIALLVLFIVALGAINTSFREAAIIRENMDNNGAALSSVLSLACPQYFVRHAYNELLALVEHIVENNGEISEVIVLDDGWRHVAHAKKGTAETELGEILGESTRALYQNIDNSKKVINRGINSIDYVSPIKAGHFKFGVVIVRYSAEIFRMEKKENLRWIIIIALISLVSGLILAAILAYFITRGIKQLTNGIKTVSQGNLSYRLDVRTSDEIGILAGKINEMIDEMEAKINMTRFVPETVSKLMKSNFDFSENKGEERKVTILFSDIRNFTTLSETHPPDEIVKMLNGYMDAMTEIIQKNNGVVDKFIGDAIMAVFYPEENSDDEFRAVTAATQMMEELWHFNQTREAAGLFTIAIGIGINTGVVIAGMIGSKNGRIDYTVIGDAVNTASRLEGMSKNGKHTKIVVSETTYSAIKNIFEAELMEADQVKGKHKSVKMYEIIGLKEIDSLLNDLKSPDEKTRFTAINLVGLTDRPELIKNILPCLKDTSPQVRIATEAALKHLMLSEDQIVKLLFDNLETETDVKVISSFIMEIGILGTDDDRFKLLKYLNHENDRIRANTIESVGLIKDRATLIGILKSRLADPNNRNRANSAIRVYQLGDLDGIRTLIAMCNDRESVLMRASGAYGLGEVTANYKVRAILENVDEVTNYIEKERFALIESARLALEALLDDGDLMVKRNAARSLGRMGNPLSIPAIVAIVRQIEKGDPFLPYIVAALKELSSPHVLKMIEEKLGFVKLN